jgi:hypothetical protein
MTAALVALGSCSEDDVVAPPSELAPPTALEFETGQISIQLSWDASPYEGASDFEGYEVYMDTTSIAARSDTSDAAFLEARKVNSSPITTRSYTVNQQVDGGNLVVGQKYYVHVRTLRDDGRLSVASNEIDTAPTIQGDNDFGDDAELMYDYSATSATKSGFGWMRDFGTGQPFATSQTNQDVIDFFLVEEPNSTDNGSEFVSPAAAAFTSGWTTRHQTRFKDLGSGAAAWATSIAPPIGDLTTKVKVIEGHTYALYLHDGHWVKLQVITLDENEIVGSEQLNRVLFRYAIQLIDDYGRFKPAPRTAP